MKIRERKMKKKKTRIPTLFPEAIKSIKSGRGVPVSGFMFKTDHYPSIKSHYPRPAKRKRRVRHKNSIRSAWK
jgi:hypothetical protein